MLRNIAEAMTPDSTLLFGEMVIPEHAGVNKYVFTMDIAMFIFGGKEGTEKEFSNLLHSAGLKLVKVWPSKTSYQTMLEARLK